MDANSRWVVVFVVVLAVTGLVGWLARYRELHSKIKFPRAMALVNRFTATFWIMVVGMTATWLLVVMFRAIGLFPPDEFAALRNKVDRLERIVEKARLDTLVTRP